MMQPIQAGSPSAVAGTTARPSAEAAIKPVSNAAPVAAFAQMERAPGRTELGNVVADLNKVAQANAQGVRFSVDEDTGRTVVKVVDTQTDTVLRQIELQADSPALRAQLFPDLRVLEALVSAGHGLSLLPRYTALKNQGRGFVLRPLRGVKASRSIVALARPEAAARTTIKRVLTMLKAEAQTVAEAPELRDASHSM